MAKRKAATSKTFANESQPAKRVHKSVEELEGVCQPEIGGLMKLNHDCILRMFDFIKVRDLCNMARTCQDMYHLAKYHFRLNYKHFNFACLIDDGLVSLKLAEELLELFGEEMVSLNMSLDYFMEQVPSVHSQYFSNMLLSMVADYCEGALKHISLDNFNHIRENVLSNLQPIFASLETFSLENCSISLCSRMEYLKTLTLNRCSGDFDQFSFTRFESLEKLELQKLHGLDDLHIVSFLERNRQLKVLSIVKSPGVTTEVFLGVRNLCDLEEFEFQNNAFTFVDQLDLIYLSSLKKLKTLTLNCNVGPIVSMLNHFIMNDIPIEHFEIAGSQMNDETAQAIAKLQTIKVLKINEMTDFDESHILHIVKGLRSLEELTIKTSQTISLIYFKRIVFYANRLSRLGIDSPNFRITADVYQQILKSIQIRVNQIKLELIIYNSGEQIHIPSEIDVENNKEWLTVKDLNRKNNHIFSHRAMFMIDEDLDFEREDSDEEDDLFSEVSSSDHFDEFDSDDELL